MNTERTLLNQTNGGLLWCNWEFKFFNVKSSAQEPGFPQRAARPPCSSAMQTPLSLSLPLQLLRLPEPKRCSVFCSCHGLKKKTRSLFS